MQHPCLFIKNMNELTINIARDFNKILGGGDRKIQDHSGEEFREDYLEGNVQHYDRIIIELDGVLGYPVDFLDVSFGVMARQMGKKKFREKFEFVSQINDLTIRKIDYLVDNCGKD